MPTRAEPKARSEITAFALPRRSPATVLVSRNEVAGGPAADPPHQEQLDRRERLSQSRTLYASASDRKDQTTDAHKAKAKANARKHGRCPCAGNCD
jgi:hypothetical protein